MNIQEIYQSRLAQQTPQEIEEQKKLQGQLSDAADLYAMKTTRGWGLMTKKMEEFIEEARYSCEQNLSADPKIAHALQIRLQQRQAVVKGIQQYVDEMISWRTVFLNPDKEPDE